ncbi:MAG TPA: SDR family oxidoreductase [Turneriella sp.]|nr:SDR family oxidoreductase [Turneriella sp.]
MENLKNKVVLITGGAGGIGLNTAAFFAEAGCRLVLTDLNEAALVNAERRLAKHNVLILTQAMDATDLKAVETLRDKIEFQFGGVDILVNNAGIGFNAEIADTSITKWRQLMDLHFWAPLYHIQTFLPAMKARKSGHIVNVSSGQAYFRAPTWGAYSVTKLAIGAMSEILSVEVARDNVHVSTVYPFLVNTGFYNTASASSFGEKLFLQFLPLYSHKPEEVAALIFNAVRENKTVEMVSVFNQFFKYMRVVNPLASVIDWMTLTFMSKKQQDAFGFSSLLERWTETMNSILVNIKNHAPKKGFIIHEVMTGEHEFTEGFGGKGKHEFFFEADWGVDNLIDFLNIADNSKFLVSTLRGTVTVGGFCQNVPMQGTIELRYLQEQKIRYTFEFEVSGERYRYIGEKRDIYPWNLLYSHTTCFGTVTKLSTGEVVSNSVTHFLMESLPQFLGSLSITG